MNYICTWLCVDEKGEESIFPQTGKKSSDLGHQQIYWRCLLLFYATSRRFNNNEKHLLFTNAAALPMIDGREVAEILADLAVEVIFTDFRYKTPKGYFGMFQNQFYEFSILEYITQNYKAPDDLFLITDSDCIFIKPAQAIFQEAEKNGFLSFEDNCTEDLVIHGLSRKMMKTVYEDLLECVINEVPGYHLGEFFLASVKNVNILFADFLALWPELMRRHQTGMVKFNEEAHTLSYLYYKNGLQASPKTNLMKRIWTNPVFYRNVEATDADLVLWHLPSEKTYGLAKLYEILVRDGAYRSPVSDNEYLALAKQALGVPYLPVQMKLNYFIVSYCRALAKLLKNAGLKLAPVLNN